MWEWRAFAARFDLELVDDDAAVEVRTDVYVAGPGVGPTRGLKLRGRRTVELKLRLGLVDEDGVERWEKPFACDIEVPSFRTRELARLAAPGGPVPVRPLRDVDGLVRWAHDVGLGPARAIVVDKRLRGALLDGGVRLEHGVVTIHDAPGGRALETVCLVGPSPAAVAAARATLAIPPDARLAGWPALLAGP